MRQKLPLPGSSWERGTLMKYLWKVYKQKQKKQICILQFTIISWTTITLHVPQTYWDLNYVESSSASLCEFLCGNMDSFSRWNCKFLITSIAVPKMPKSIAQSIVHSWKGASHARCSSAMWSAVGDDPIVGMERTVLALILLWKRNMVVYMIEMVVAAVIRTGTAARQMVIVVMTKCLGEIIIVAAMSWTGWTTVCCTHSLCWRWEWAFLFSGYWYVQLCINRIWVFHGFNIFRRAESMVSEALERYRNICARKAKWAAGISDLTIELKIIECSFSRLCSIEYSRLW